MHKSGGHAQHRCDAEQVNRIEVDKNIRTALDGKDELFGMKLTPSMKKDTYSDITTKNFLNSIFYDKKGEVNYNGMVEAAFLIKNIKNIMKSNMTKYTNKGIEGVLNEVSNPVVRRNGEYAAPKEKKETTDLGDYMSALKKHGPQ